MTSGPLSNLALAYLGPGGALTTVGSLLALAAAVVLAVIGFVWYPVKRLLARMRRSKDVTRGATAAGGQDRAG